MDSVAKELAGHGSDAVSALYMHLPDETLSKAIDRLAERIHWDNAGSLLTAYRLVGLIQTPEDSPNWKTLLYLAGIN